MRFIEGTTGAICAVLILIGVGVNFANVVGRYIFSSPLAWAEDFLVYANIWLIFLGAALTSFRGRHLSMDLLRGAVRGRADGVLTFVTALVTLAACGAVAWISGQFVLRMYQMGQRSISLDIPMYVPHSAVLAGFSLITLALLLQVVQLVRRGFKPAPDTVEDDAEEARI